jgi:hypothetical protein
MKVASKITQTEIVKEESLLLLEAMPENWHYKFILLVYKDIRGYTWNQIFIKLGYVDENGRPDENKGDRLKKIYHRFKKHLILSETEKEEIEVEQDLKTYDQETNQAA